MYTVGFIAHDFGIVGLLEGQFFINIINTMTTKFRQKRYLDLQYGIFGKKFPTSLSNTSRVWVVVERYCFMDHIYGLKGMSSPLITLVRCGEYTTNHLAKPFEIHYNCMGYGKEGCIEGRYL